MHPPPDRLQEAACQRSDRGRRAKHHQQARDPATAELRDEWPRQIAQTLRARFHILQPSR